MTLPKPISVMGIAQKLVSLMPETRSPLNAKGTGNQGCLYHLPPRAAKLLLSTIEATVGEDFLASLYQQISAGPVSETEKLNLARSRVGQGKFRDSLLGLWNNKCCVSGLDVIEMLRVSHIKPWRDSNNRERLDPDNGLLLGPQYDAAFDKGLITFDTTGHILLTHRITTSRLARAGINGGESVMQLTEAHQRYLDFHRRTVFLR